MDARYQVFIEGARDGAGAVDRLGQSIAARYGFQAQELVTRLAAGRVRVKRGVDLITAERFAADLERLGASVIVVDEESGQPLSRGSSPLVAESRVATGERLSIPDLGALESGLFTLSALDGSDGASPATSASSFGPPDPRAPVRAPTSPTSAPGRPATAPARAPTSPTPGPGRAATAPAAGPRASSSSPATPASADHQYPASFGPPPDLGDLSLSVPSAGRPSSGGPSTGAIPILDPFAPPAADTAVELSIDVEPVRRNAGTISANPPPVAAPAPRPVAARMAGGTSAAGGTSTGGTGASMTGKSLGSLTAPLRRFARNERARFVTGVVLAVLLGAVVSQVFASVRQRDAFAEIDARVVERQNEVSTVDEWTQLDVLREAQLERKRAAHRNVALLALAMWTGVAAGVGYVWFRRVDWQRLAT